MKINFDKSSLLVLNDYENVENLVANTLSCKTMNFPFDYLSFVIRPSRLKHDDWLIIIDKIKIEYLIGMGDYYLEQVDWF